MKNGKAEVLDLKLEENGALRVKLAGRDDRDLYVAAMRALCAPGTISEILSAMEVYANHPAGGPQMASDDLLKL